MAIYLTIYIYLFLLCFYDNGKLGIGRGPNQENLPGRASLTHLARMAATEQAEAFRRALSVALTCSNCAGSRDALAAIARPCHFS